MSTLKISREELEKRLDPIIEHYRDETTPRETPSLQKGATIPLLADIQKEFGYVAEEAVIYAAERTGISAAEMFGVATFYAMFRFKPQGKYVIRLCRGTACHVQGSARIAEQLERTLGVKDGDTTDDRLFTIQHVACLGCCSLAPVMMMNDEVHGRLTPEKAAAILDTYK